MHWSRPIRNAPLESIRAIAPLFVDLEEAQGRGHEHGGEGQQHQQVGPDVREALVEEDDLVEDVHGPVGGGEHAQSDLLKF